MELKNTLLERFGKRPYEYFKLAIGITKEKGETYRGLQARYITRLVDGKDPFKVLSEELFLNALPRQQEQWIRRNQGSSTVVEASEDYSETSILRPPLGPA